MVVSKNNRVKAHIMESTIVVICAVLAFAVAGLAYIPSIDFIFLGDLISNGGFIAILFAGGAILCLFLNDV
jgi:hypothetical protein